MLGKKFFHPLDSKWKGVKVVSFMICDTKIMLQKLGIPLNHNFEANSFTITLRRSILFVISVYKVEINFFSTFYGNYFGYILIIIG